MDALPYQGVVDDPGLRHVLSDDLSFRVGGRDVCHLSDGVDDCLLTGGGGTVGRCALFFCFLLFFSLFIQYTLSYEHVNRSLDSHLCFMSTRAITAKNGHVCAERIKKKNPCKCQATPSQK